MCTWWTILVFGFALVYGAPQSIPGEYSSTYEKDVMRSTQDILEKIALVNRQQGLERKVPSYYPFFRWGDVAKSSFRFPENPYTNPILDYVARTADNENLDESSARKVDANPTPSKEVIDMTVDNQNKEDVIPPGHYIKRKITHHQTVFLTPDWRMNVPNFQNPPSRTSPGMPYPYLQPNGDAMKNLYSPEFYQSPPRAKQFQSPLAQFFPILIKDPLLQMYNAFTSMIEYGQGGGGGGGAAACKPPKKKTRDGTNGQDVDQSEQVTEENLATTDSVDDTERVDTDVQSKIKGRALDLHVDGLKNPKLTINDTSNTYTVVNIEDLKIRENQSDDSERAFSQDTGYLAKSSLDLGKFQISEETDGEQIDDLKNAGKVNSTEKQKNQAMSVDIEDLTIVNGPSMIDSPYVTKFRTLDDLEKTSNLSSLDVINSETVNNSSGRIAREIKYDSPIIKIIPVLRKSKNKALHPLLQTLSVKHEPIEDKVAGADDVKDADDEGSTRDDVDLFTNKKLFNREQTGSGVFIHRLKVRRGGVAIAGPGGIATAGSGGTAIVGPNGLAYTQPDSVAVAGHGTRVVAVEPHVDLTALAEEAHRNRTRGYGHVPRTVRGKVVAVGPVVYYNRG